MKRIAAFFILFFASCYLFAVKTIDNTLKFIGIPVDGTEQRMVASLREKEGRFHEFQGNLSGQFNGEDL